MVTTQAPERPAVPSQLADLRDVPLADVPDLDAEIDGVLERLFPGTAVPPVPTAEFNSSI